MTGQKTNTIRVFVGTSPRGDDAEACAVLEHSLRSRSSLPVDIEWMVPSRDRASPYFGWRTDTWATPWTALRWAVPALCNWQGRAIYFDCAQIVLGDVAELQAAEIPEGACVLARREGASIRTGCLVFDCKAARGRMPGLRALRADAAAHQTVGSVLATREEMMAPLPAGWGMRDIDFSREPDSVTGSVHLAATALQPHLLRADARLRREGRAHWLQAPRLPHYSQRLVDLWEAEYAAAVKDGREVARYVFSNKFSAEKAE